jgi:glucosamine--fructose-6-phosphate aminotransferase (isomerizing)
MALAGVTDRIVYLEEGDVVDLQLGKHWVSQPTRTARIAASSDRCARSSPTPAPPSSGRTATTCKRRSSSSRRRSPTRSTPSRRLARAVRRRRVPRLQGTRLGPHPRLRDELLQRLGRQVLARVVRQDPDPVEVASEYRYRDSVPNPRTLVVTISQSGETADTLAALKHARSLGMAHTLTVCNVATSAMVRECAMAYITRAGVEIGVASTKAFTTQLVGLFLLTLALAQVRGRLTDARSGAPEGAAPPAGRGAGGARARAADHRLERGVRVEGERALPRPRHALSGRARRRAEAEGDQLHPRRGVPGGRAQARPLALVTSEMPVVAIAPNDACSRSSRAICTRCARAAASCSSSPTPTRGSHSGEGVHVIRMPEHYGALSPILHVVPLQLLAYHTAVARGTDVDKPRNLAKSVTVE